MTYIGVSRVLKRLIQTELVKCYSTNVSYKGAKATVKGLDIHYEEVGEGKHVVLLMPGALGSTRTDFSPQLDGGLDQKAFTIVAWDPPGYGYSRPPERTFPKDYLIRDALIAAGLMAQLGHNQYSAVGWSDGATTALHLAANEPEKVKKIVLWGGGAYLTPQDLKAVEATRDVNKWSQRMRTPMEAIYGIDRFRALWGEYCDAWLAFGTTKSSILQGDEEGGDGDLALGTLHKIKCPTLVVHGDLDPMIDPVHHRHLTDVLPDAKLVNFKEGKHNLHLRYAKEFNALVQDFLLKN